MVLNSFWFPEGSFFILIGVLVLHQIVTFLIKVVEFVNENTKEIRSLLFLHELLGNNFISLFKSLDCSRKISVGLSFC
jgi:hypothetical protein